MVAQAATRSARVLVASNRGPVSHTLDDRGELSAKRGGGGLVSGLSAIGPEAGAVWVCAALSDGDREAVRRAGVRLDQQETGGQAVRMLDIPAETFTSAYNGVANSVLWFVHHLLYQTPLEPAFDAEFQRQWSAYEEYNAAFAEALAEEAAEGAAVLVQDYHLTLVPARLRQLRPDLRISHFSHTPWAPPDYFRLLPDEVAGQVLRGVLGADRAGFLSRRWAESFADCCARVLGAEVAGWTGGRAVGGQETADGEELRITHAGRTTHIGVYGLGADPDFLRERAHRADVAERMSLLREQIGDHQTAGHQAAEAPGHCPAPADQPPAEADTATTDGGDRLTIVRVDRTELSKNIVRGLLAYRRLLVDRPQWRGRVTHLAFAYPSRQDLRVYREYTEEVSRVAEEINSSFGQPGWTPVLLHVEDDFARSLAAYRMADVALVNPIRDGMNLVAKEVPVVSDEGCALVLSREAGAFGELGGDAFAINPYDISDTARALHEALSMPRGERAERTKRLAAAATALPPERWFLQQLEALRS